MVDVREENKEIMLLTKNGENKFYLAHYSSKMQGVSRETKRATRETQMSCDAVVNLTDGKTRQLTGARREISPMQWVDTDENTHLRGESDYVRVLAKHKGRTTGHADLETTEGLLRRSSCWKCGLSTTSFAVGVHKLMYTSIHAIPRTDIPKHKKLAESCCIMFRKERLQVELSLTSRLSILWYNGCKD